IGRGEEVGAVEVDRVDLVELDEAGDGDRSRVVRRRKGLEVGVLDEDELALRYLPALDDLVVRDLAVVLGAPALVLDRRPALAVQHPERHVRLPGSRLRGQGHPDGDVDQTEADGSVPDCLHEADHPNSSANEAAYLLQHAEVVGGLAEDETQLAKIEALGLAHVLTLADLEGLREQGIAFAREHPEALDAAAAAVDEEDIYTYIYTSGTTGPPKGCMIRHRNYYAMTSSIERVEDLWLVEDVMLLYLPLAHNFGRLMSLWGAYAGFTIAFCPDPYAVAEALPQVRPTLLPSVPRLYEKAHAAITSNLEAASGPRRRLVGWAIGVGRRVSALRQHGRPLPRALALQHRIAYRLLYSKVK